MSLLLTQLMRDKRGETRYTIQVKKYEDNEKKDRTLHTSINQTNRNVTPINWFLLLGDRPPLATAIFSCGFVYFIFLCTFFFFSLKIVEFFIALNCGFVSGFNFISIFLD